METVKEIHSTCQLSVKYVFRLIQTKANLRFLHQEMNEKEKNRKKEIKMRIRRQKGKGEKAEGEDEGKREGEDENDETGEELDEDEESLATRRSGRSQ
ncbi:unnamed protein product [Soboliphyme baturini]|uniref:Uncharacterized protein n=1 Tax=Soboliphyme baturini TaxID=241478 RepID=A0A183INP4_9BILA|nr:unnamed protein product [Soboliphyme baturini]